MVHEAEAGVKSPETFVTPESNETARVVEAMVLSKIVVIETVLFTTFTMEDPVAADPFGASVSTVKAAVVVAGALLPSRSRPPEMRAMTDGSFIPCGA